MTKREPLLETDTVKAYHVIVHTPTDVKPNSNLHSTVNTDHDSEKPRKWNEVTETVRRRRMGADVLGTACRAALPLWACSHQAVLWRGRPRRHSPLPRSSPTEVQGWAAAGQLLRRLTEPHRGPTGVRDGQALRLPTRTHRDSTACRNPDVTAMYTAPTRLQPSNVPDVTQTHTSRN